MLTWNNLKTFVNNMTAAELLEEVKIGLDHSIVGAFSIHSDNSCPALGNVTMIDCTPSLVQPITIAA